jgi:dynein heavy chain
LIFCRIEGTKDVRHDKKVGLRERHLDRNQRPFNAFESRNSLPHIVDPLPESRPVTPETRKWNSYAQSNYKLENHDFLIRVAADPYEPELDKPKNRLTPLDRYVYYVQRAIPTQVIAEMEKDQMHRIHGLIPRGLVQSEQLRKLREALEEEVVGDYELAAKQSVIDYILLDSDEQRRLFIPHKPYTYIPTTIRAPVPWHSDMQLHRSFISENLFVTNPIMKELVRLFEDSFGTQHIVDMSVFVESVLPMSIQQFLNILKVQCIGFRNRLLNEWIPAIANIFFATKNTWYTIATGCDDPDVGYRRLDYFFKSVCALMSNQLWTLVTRSLDYFENFFLQFQNATSEVSLFSVKLMLSGQQLRFEPPMFDIETTLISVLEEIVGSCRDIPRIETKLFTSLADQRLVIPSMTLDDKRIGEPKLLKMVMGKNSLAPQKHLLAYDKFRSLITFKAEKKVEEFLSEKHNLEEYQEVGCSEHYSLV